MTEGDDNSEPTMMTAFWFIVFIFSSVMLIMLAVPWLNLAVESVGSKYDRYYSWVMTQ